MGTGQRMVDVETEGISDRDRPEVPTNSSSHHVVQYQA